MAIRERYYNATETTQECKHTWPDGESAIVSYRPKHYHGRVKKCQICEKKRVLDTSTDSAVGYIEQADLWSVSRETETET